jgi:hypothetical protein
MAPLRIPGGKPVIADPGKMPMFPVTTVPTVPVLVTVDPARIAYEVAKPRSIGASHLTAENSTARLTKRENKEWIIKEISSEDIQNIY